MLQAVERGLKRVRELTREKEDVQRRIGDEMRDLHTLPCKEEVRLNCEKHDIDVKLAVVRALKRKDNVVELQKGSKSEILFDEDALRAVWSGFDPKNEYYMDEVRDSLVEALQSYVPDGLRATDPALKYVCDETWSLTFRLE